MSKSMKAKKSVVDYLKEIYPQPATKDKIMREIGIKISGCLCDRALKTLRSRGNIQVVGKEGNANLYRFNPS